MKFSEFEADPNFDFEKVKNENPEGVQNIEEQIKKYENLSGPELMEEFFKESKKQKASGYLDDEKLANIKNTLTPFLNLEQQQKLNELMGLINDK